MSDSPDAIRADIERTRVELGSDVDALADKVTPSKIVDRQADKVRGAFRSARDRVMGSPDDPTSSGAAGAMHGVADAARDVKRTAEGSPLAVGLIAFGVGLLAASLIPASEKEKALAQKAKEQAQPVVDEVTDAAKAVAADLKEPAKDAASAIQDRARDAVENVKSETTDAADAVKERTQEARGAVADG